jgi:hypothetical protein
MKITVELPENELVEICEITGVTKKGPAIRKLLTDALRTQRRAKIANQFLNGESSAGLDSFEAAKTADRAQAQTLSEQWRD